MAVANAPIFVQVIQTWALQLVLATGTTITSVVAAGTNGSKIEFLQVASTDTAAHTMNLYINDGAVNHLIGTVNIPITAGDTTAIPPVNLLNNAQLPNLPRDSNGNPYIYLKTGYSLRVAVTVAVTTALVVEVLAFGADF